MPSIGLVLTISLYTFYLSLSYSWSISLSLSIYLSLLLMIFLLSLSLSNTHSFSFSLSLFPMTSSLPLNTHTFFLILSHKHTLFLILSLFAPTFPFSVCLTPTIIFPQLKFSSCFTNWLQGPSKIIEKRSILPHAFASTPNTLKQKYTGRARCETL